MKNQRSSHDVTAASNPDPEKATAPLPRASVKQPLPPKTEMATSINTSGKNQNSDFPSTPAMPEGANQQRAMSHDAIRAQARKYGNTW
jgi:hypothetical protein